MPRNPRFNQFVFATAEPLQPGSEATLQTVAPVAFELTHFYFSNRLEAALVVTGLRVAAEELISPAAPIEARSLNAARMVGGEPLPKWLQIPKLNPGDPIALTVRNVGSDPLEFSIAFPELFVNGIPEPADAGAADGVDPA